MLVRGQSAHIDRLRRLNLPVEGKMREIVAAQARIVDAIEAGDVIAAQDADWRSTRARASCSEAVRSWRTPSAPIATASRRPSATTTIGASAASETGRPGRRSGSAKVLSAGGLTAR
jgi:hypothetical protein